MVYFLVLDVDTYAAAAVGLLVPGTPHAAAVALRPEGGYAVAASPSGAIEKLCDFIHFERPRNLESHPAT